MEIIAAFDAKTRLSELLDRAAQGESFLITKHGRPVGRLVPPDRVRDPAAMEGALERLRRFRGALGEDDPHTIRALVDEGRRC
jgi:prevent-host-death family protein